MKVARWVALLAIAAGCSEYKPCRPGTVRISVVCDASAKDIGTALVRLDDQLLPQGKDIAVPLHCPGQTSLEVAVTDYVSGRMLRLAATPQTADGPGKTSGPMAVELAPGCTSITLAIDPSAPGDGSPVGTGGASGTADGDAHDAAIDAEAPDLETPPGPSDASPVGGGGAAGTLDSGAHDDAVDAETPDRGTPPDGGADGARDTSDRAIVPETGPPSDGGADATRDVPDEPGPSDAGLPALDSADHPDAEKTDAADTSDGSTSLPDVGISDADSPAEAGSPPPPPTPPCDLTKPFTSLASVSGLPPSAGGLHFTSDELTTFFVFGEDLYSASRLRNGDPFGNATALVSLNSPALEATPSVSGSGLQIFFESNRSGTFNIWTAQRTSLSSPFTTLTLFGTAQGGGPYLLSDSSALYFHCVGQGIDICRAALVPSSAPPSVKPVSFNTADTEANPVVTPDELTVFFSSDRAGGQGDLDIWVAHRQDPSLDFEPPTNVAELNTADIEAPTWISSDGCRLYFERVSATGKGRYLAQRPPLPPP